MKYYPKQTVRYRSSYGSDWVNAEVIIVSDKFIRIRTEHDEDIELLMAGLSRDVIRPRK
jgi:hypothetical protein